MHDNDTDTGEIQYSTRVTIPIRTYRTRAKTLSLYQYHYLNREKGSGEDIAYLFLEDKSSPDGDENVPRTEDKTKGQNEEATEGDDVQIIEPPTDKTGIEGKKRKRMQYQTLAVKPAASVVPMLQNLLNPFVMGVTKSARQVGLSLSRSSIPNFNR